MKKAASLLMAVMMLLSIFSVSAFAADANVNDATMAIRVIPTAASYKAGEVVTFEVEYETTSELGNVGACTLYFGYDGDVFEIIDEDKALIASAPGLDKTKTVVLEGYALDGTIAPGMSFIQESTSLVDADTAKGWDSVLKVAMTQDGDLFDASTATKAFAFKLKVKDTAASGSYAVGVTQAGLDDYSAFVNEAGGAINGPLGSELGFNATKVFDLVDANVTVEGGAGGSEEEKPTETVKNLDVQVQWADKAAGKMNVGFRGEIAGFDLDANKTTTVTDKDNGTYTKLNRLQEVGVIYTRAGGDPEKVKSEAIYDFNSNTYFYRVVVGNIPYDNKEVLTAQAYIVVGGVEVKADDVISTTGAQEYARATGLATNPMPKK